VDSATFARLGGWQCQSYGRISIIPGILSGLEPSRVFAFREVHTGFTCVNSVQNWSKFNSSSVTFQGEPHD
jgi:hypothetical protein